MADKVSGMSGTSEIEGISGHEGAAAAEERSDAIHTLIHGGPRNSACAVRNP